MMRVGMFSEVYKPVINGVVYSMEDFKHALEQEGHEVFIFTSMNKKADKQKDKEEKIYRCPAIPIKGGYSLSFPGLFSSEAKKIMKSCDIFHVQHPFTICGFAAEFGKHHKIPVVFTSHTQYHNYSHYIPFFGAKAKLLIINHVRNFASKCKRVIVPGHAVSRILFHEYGIKNISVVPNGVEIEPFRKASKKRKGFSKKLIYTGRLAEEKSIDTVLIAFQKIVHEDGEFTLTLVGDGPERKHLESFAQQLGISKNVKFMGFISHDQLPTYYANADFFITASKTEVHPLTIIESMAAGCVPVAVDAPGINDIVADSVSGVLTSDSGEALAKAIINLARDKKRLEKLRKNGYARAEEFDAKNSVKKLISVYKDVIGE